MNNTQPENDQLPAWFVDTGTPVVPPPSPADPAIKKKLILILSIVALIVFAGVGIFLYATSIQNAKQNAALGFQEAYMDFYTSLSSIDDRLEPEGVDPTDIASRWQDYNNSLVALKKSPLYSDSKDTIDTIESLSSTYDSFVIVTIPELAGYMTGCTFNNEAGTPDISDSCYTHLQNITDSPDSPAHPVATRLLTIFSNTKSNNLMTEADIANVRDLEDKMFTTPHSFAELIGPEIAKLGESVGVNFNEE